MVLTNTRDQEELDTDNVRYHLNASLSFLAEQLNLAASPWYGVTVEATLEPVLHISGLESINLGTVGSQLFSINRVTVARAFPPIVNAWVGNCVRKDIAEIANVQSYNNRTYRQSIMWAQNGNEILLFVGSEISTIAVPVTSEYDISSSKFAIWANRNPQLDDLLPRNSSLTYRVGVDLPDKYMELLIKLVEKRVIEQLGQEMPQTLQQEIDLGLQKLNELKQLKEQMAVQQEVKVKTGSRING